MENTDYKKLQRASYISATLTALGFSIVLASLLYSYNKIEQKQQKVNLLIQQEEQLDAKIKTQELRIKELEIASSPESIIVRNRRLKLKGVLDAENRQIFDYSIWLEVPILLKDKITKVVYNFPDSSMFNKVRESTEAANGYGVSYRGWGCFPDMKVNIHLKDRVIHTLVFDQCADNSPIKSIQEG